MMRLIGISSGMIPRHHRRSAGAEASTGPGLGRSRLWHTTRCARFCPSPGGPKSGRARSRSPAAPIRYCRRRSASGRRAPPPQAATIASLPLMEIFKIGDSPRERLPESDRPLSGIRVLDLTRVLAGPTAARTLAEHGADVLKITAPHLPNIGYQEYDTGHGKLSAHLDLRYPRDLEILRGLVREADVFSQGYRPGTLGNRRLSPEELLKLRPGLVYVSMCAFSHAGPWASRRGFDTVVQT